MPVDAPRADFSSGYVRRVVDDELDELFPSLPALAIRGARAVGKTETALSRARTVRRLDREAEQAIAEASPDEALLGEKPVLLDEWQRVPALWDAVKRAVDRNAAPEQYLLTGSPPHDGHSGAMRIDDLYLRPLTLPERGVARPTVSLRALLAGDSRVEGSTAFVLGDYVDEILRSGFPGVQHMDGRALRTRLDTYVRRIVEHDIEVAGFRVRRPEALFAWLRAYAAAVGTTATWETVRRAATPGHGTALAKTTVAPYIEALADLDVLDEVEAWIPGNNHIRRVGQAPKHFLVDPALAVRLLGLGREQLLAGESGQVEIPRDGTYLGALFESLVAMSLKVFAQACESRLTHLRSHDAEHEIDFLVVVPDGHVVAVEVKLAQAIDDHDVRHLRWLRDVLGDQLIDSVVVSTGPYAYRRADGVAIVPLSLLGP